MAVAARDIPFSAGIFDRLVLRQIYFTRRGNYHRQCMRELKEQKMCVNCLNSHRGSMTRRDALGLTVSALAAGLVVPQAMAANDKPPPKPQNVIAPDAALDRLMKGNSRYVAG